METKNLEKIYDLVIDQYEILGQYIENPNLNNGLKILEIQSSILIELVEQELEHVKNNCRKMEAFCIRCRQSYTSYPALSRRDNTTSICSDCGEMEALNDMTPYNKISLEQKKIEMDFHESIGKNFKIWQQWKNQQYRTHKEFSARGISDDDSCTFGV